MLKKGSTATSPSDIAVDVRSVVKVFTQSQRENAGNGVLKRLARPEKKRVYALDNVTFQIRRGEFVAYAGPNGAGKSTTMKLLCGMLLPTDGKVSVLGLSPEKKPDFAHEEARRAVRQPDGAMVGSPCYAELRVEKGRMADSGECLSAEFGDGN